MRILRIRPTYFRGFGASDWIDLSCDLVVLHGPNGFGKTSLAEAIEWLFYGETDRRRSGERESKRDYHGSYRNVHAPARIDTAVEAEVLLDGKTRTLKRVLRIGDRASESSQTFVDGPAASFESVRVGPEELYKPVIQQHSLQHFIHRPPKERRDAIGATLGLGPLVRYKTALDRARSRFQQAPPPAVVAAKKVIRQLGQRMIAFDGTREVGERWQKGTVDPAGDRTTMLGAARRFAGAEDVAWADVVLLLRERRLQEARHIFDARPLIPSAAVADDAPMQAAHEPLLRAEEGVRIALGDLLATAAGIYSRELVSFWLQGLQLAGPEHTDLCPMCEEHTLPDDKREMLRARIGQDAAVNGALARLEAAVAAAENACKRMGDAASAAFTPFLDPQQREAAAKAFAGNQDKWPAFLAAHDDASAAHAGHRADTADLVRQLRTVPMLAVNPETSRDAVSITASLAARATASATRARAAATRYAGAYAAFEPTLRDVVADAGSVREIDAHLEPLEQWASVTAVAEYDRLLTETQALIRALEDHIQSKQTELFASRGREINTWYDLMCPGADVRYDRMQPATDSLTLWATSFGVDLNATACLSQSQLNSIGLSIHLMRALTPGTPFGFMIFDDPVQSMDEEHVQAFSMQVIQALLAAGKQVLVLTHERQLADDLWDLYYHASPKLLRIAKFEAAGPTIEDAETWDDALRRASKWAKGNEEHRRVAMQALRRATELLARATCKLHGVACPANANAKDLLAQFRTVPRVTVPWGDVLERAIKFANPAPHTQRGWAPPLAQQIEPHVQALFRIGNDLRLPKTDA